MLEINCVFSGSKGKNYAILLFKTFNLAQHQHIYLNDTGFENYLMKFFWSYVKST